MPKILISYRRADTDAIAGRIRDRLAAHFGDASIFMDIDSIPFGRDFRSEIKQAMAPADVVLAIIGPKWLGSAKGGGTRIKDETDPVRVEVETAMEKGIPVVPVLVNGTVMPKPTELPESLREFAYRNACEVNTGRDFHPQVDRLIRSIDPTAQPSHTTITKPVAASGPGRRIPLIVAGAVAVCAVAAAAAWLILGGGLRKQGSGAEFSEFVNCNARVLYPTASYRVVPSDRRSASAPSEALPLSMLMHVDGQGRIYLNAWFQSPTTDNVAIHAALLRQPDRTVTYANPDKTVVSGFYKDPSGHRMVYYYRFHTQMVDGRPIIRMFEHLYPSDDATKRTHDTLNEIVSRTLIPEGVSSMVRNDCVWSGLAEFRVGATTPSEPMPSDSRRVLCRMKGASLRVGPRFPLVREF